MKNVVVCFSGRIGSGKTTISIEVAGRLGWPRASFGDFVRETARSRKLDESSREILAELGASIIETQGWKTFCENVLAAPEWDRQTGLVVDGIRHKEALAQIARLVAPMQTLLVHLELSDSTATPLRHDGKGVESSGSTEQHSTERQVRSELPTVADLILPAEKPIEVLAKEVVEFVSK